MKKTSLSWCAACMLCVLGVMTSCSDDDKVREIPGSGQDQSGVVAELEGKWIVDLDGRRLQGKPDQKGIYINSCRKVVVK